MRELLEVIDAQRACRWFTDDAVPDADVVRMLEAAVRAPSAENAQPWVFVVVRDDDQRRAVADLTRRLWNDGARAHSAGRLSAALLADVDGSINAGYGGAPVLILVAADTSLVPRGALASSVFPAVQNLLLAAAALDYGSALTTLAAIARADLQAIVALPEHIEPVAVVPIGRPARALGPSRRALATEKTHRDRFGTPFG
jgi:nitroreductase